MRNAGRSKLLAIVALVALAIPLALTVPTAAADGDDDQYDIPEKRELKYPNLGSHLDQLVASVEAGEVLAEDAAKDASISQGESVAVTIHLSGNLDDVVTYLEDNGGSARNVGEDYIEAYVPVTLLGPVSEQPGVIRVREIVPPEDALGDFTSQGVQAHGAPVWHQAGLSGQGISVGVIDGNFGFRDFRDLIGTELPTPAGVRCYPEVGRSTGNLADCEHTDRGSAHGTVVAEAVVDIAPEVALYIASPLSGGDTNDAVDWMVSQGVSVIVRSESTGFDGPGDGTSPYSNSPLKTVDRAVNGGVVWVNSAGNYAQQTWFGPPVIGFLDIVDFFGNDSGNEMTLEVGDAIAVDLRWDDRWGGATSDFDVCIFHRDIFGIGECNFDLQAGGDGHVPSEYLRYRAVTDGVYEVVVFYESGSVPAWIQLVVYGVDSIEHYTGHGSITNPAESAKPGMLAVGAAPWFDVHTIQPFSSRGPTPDGRVKPEVVGADCGETALRPLREQRYGFCGTSQAAPHVAGMAALVRQRFPEYSPVQVADYLKDHAEQRGTVPNYTWGYGFAQLPPDDAVVPPPDARVTISPSEVNIGDTVTVTMSNYAPGLISEIKIGGVALDLTDPALAISDLVVPSSGQHSFSFVIPATVGDTPIPLGRVLVEVIGPATPSFDNHASAYITISMAETTDPCVTPLGTLTGAATETGSWTGDCDSSNRSGRHARFYSFTLEQETEVQIDLTSSQDTYLFLLQGAGKDGTVVDENDDAESGNPDSGSHITATLDAVTYTIEATTYSAGATGDFSLTITPAGTPTPGPTPTDPCGQTLTGDGSVSGEWAEGCDSEVAERGYVRYYSFALAEESEVTITLTRESGDADTYLYLREGEARSGDYLHQDDDYPASGDTDMSQIQESLEAGTYTIEATTYGAGETGSFTLTISGLGTTAQPPEPTPTDPCRQTLTGDGSVSGEWAEGCDSEVAERGYARYYSFALAEESEVTITLTRESGDADTYLYLREGEARSGDYLHQDDDYPASGDTDMSQIQESLEAGTYTIEATTYGAGETGSFTLTISGLGTTAQPPGPTPTDPCGQTLSGDGSIPGQWAEGCDSEVAERGYARYYSFTLAEESEVTITLTRESGDADTYLYLREGEARSGDYLHQDDDYPASGDTDMSQIQESLEAGTYTIEATTYGAGETGSFTLTLAGLGAAAPSQSCSVGQTLAPGERCSHQDFTIEVEGSGALLMRFTGDEAPPQGLSLSRSGDSWSIEGLP